MLLEENSMILDFKGHHFVEDSKPEEWPIRHHCERCSLKAELRPDGSADFRDGRGTLVGISGTAPMSASSIPLCK
jgi:hypothetical protein